MVSVFSVYEEEGILEALVRRGSISDSAERTITKVKNDVPAASIAILVYCELNQYILTFLLLECLQGMLEHVNPAVVCEDETGMMIGSSVVLRCIRCSGASRASYMYSRALWDGLRDVEGGSQDGVRVRCEFGTLEVLPRLR